jgi:cob(I)alamin adenosyltransferase
VRIYTKRGDDGTTGLLFGGRVQKSAKRIEVNGAVDEAQAALGLGRAELERGSELHDLLVTLERDLWVLMAEVATAPANRKKLVPGTSLVTAEMVAALEVHIDDLTERSTMPAEFVVPGENRPSAALDVARTAVRRAERVAVTLPMPGSLVVPYLNRLSDLVWTMARVAEGADHRTARTNPRQRPTKES